MNNKKNNNIIENEKIVNKFKSIFKTTISVLSMLFILSTKSYANIQSSKLYTGSEKLLNDLSNALLVFVPIICGLVGIFMGIALAASDDQDKKTWKNRLKWLFFGFIIAMTIGGVLKIIGNYYK